MHQDHGLVEAWQHELGNASMLFGEAGSPLGVGGQHIDDDARDLAHLLEAPLELWSSINRQPVGRPICLEPATQK